MLEGYINDDGNLFLYQHESKVGNPAFTIEKNSFLSLVRYLLSEMDEEDTEEIYLDGGVGELTEEV